MSKFLVQGKDAGRFLNRLSTANVDGDCETITYTQWLNEQGKLQGDLTIVKMAQDKFMVVATDTMLRHTEMHMNQRIGEDEFVVVTDVSGQYAQINLQGPRSRELLAKITATDVSDEAFPFRMAKEIDIGFSRVLCNRITYVGELGYELFVPTEHALGVYDTVVKHGVDVDLKHAGLKALSSLRMEKGYRDYGHDMDNTDTLLQVGLSFTCDMEKEGGFIGKDHVLAEKRNVKENGGICSRLLQILVLDNPDVMMHHGEVVWRNGQRVGDVRAASYGFTLGGACGLAMINAGEPINKAFVSSGEWEVEVGGNRFPCKLSLAPMYDPKNLKIKSK